MKYRDEMLNRFNEQILRLMITPNADSRHSSDVSFILKEEMNMISS